MKHSICKCLPSVLHGLFQSKLTFLIESLTIKFIGLLPLFILGSIFSPKARGAKQICMKQIIQQKIEQNMPW